ncbi:MAG: hypothetical protein JW814_03410 [Candidatus Krumholzibacteriota bacterium]|nr:hypothetical protein [Candidatus Krumholzibacteriota bacterium]
MSLEKKRPFTVRIVENRKLSPSTYLIILERPNDFPDPYPGQFISVRVNDQTVPLLRRPFGIMDINSETMTILVKAVGPGSTILASKAAGEQVEMAGPLGGMPFSRPGGKDVVFVGGGTGLGPIIFCARSWKREATVGKMHLFIGAQTKEELLEGLYEKDFDQVYTATIDGSSGHKGNIVELLEEEIEKGGIPAAILYSCGPRPMIRALIDRVGPKFENHYTSLESVMACSLGACRGCTVPVIEDGEKTLRSVCMEGTVFRAEDIDWEEWE